MMKYFSCGKCGLGFKTPCEVEIHLGTNHGISGNFQYREFTPGGVTPITGPEEPSEIYLDANADSETPPEPPKAHAHAGDTAAKETNEEAPGVTSPNYNPVLNPIGSTKTGAKESGHGHESAQKPTVGESGATTADRDT